MIAWSTRMGTRCFLLARLLDLTDRPLQSVDLDEALEGAEIDDDRKIEVYQTEADVNSLAEAQMYNRIHLFRSGEPIPLCRY